MTFFKKQNNFPHIFALNRSYARTFPPKLSPILT